MYRMHSYGGLLGTPNSGVNRKGHVFGEGSTLLWSWSVVWVPFTIS